MFIYMMKKSLILAVQYKLNLQAESDTLPPTFHPI